MFKYEALLSSQMNNGPFCFFTKEVKNTLHVRKKANTIRKERK